MKIRRSSIEQKAEIILWVLNIAHIMDIQDMGTSKLSSSPFGVASENDPGDETLRNYRYQVSYGVILLINAASNRLPYKSIYAEHHEDFLCERNDSKVDCYQVKTRKPEEGEWDLSDEPLKRSIRRFTELHRKFEEHIEKFYFVSNASYSNPSKRSHDVTKNRRSPIHFLNHIAECESVSDIQDPYLETFRELEKYCECSPARLLKVLKMVGLINGPDRNSFDAEIVATHLPVMDGCGSLAVTSLNAIRDELVQKVFYASSLKVDDPSKHWTPINSDNELNPIILAKRVPVLEVSRTIADTTATPFRYSNTLHPALNLGHGTGNIEKLRKKMLRGDLAFQIETMVSRSISAERRLIEIAHRKPESADVLLTQLVSVVKGECDEAYHHASVSGNIIGPQMLDDVFKRLKDKANLAITHGEPYETLIGIAGLLTGECKVWWSEIFDLEDDRHGA